MTQLACAKAKPERPLGVAFHKQLREEARSSTPNTSPRNGNAVREFANKSAASAASPDSVKFQAVIKSAASAASQIQGTQVQGSAGRRGTVGRRGRPDDGSVRTTERGAPLELPSLDFAFGEAALAADLITALNFT